MTLLSCDQVRWIGSNLIALQGILCSCVLFEVLSTSKIMPN